jgi:predicted transglutaminase-like cysteine proteinase
MRSLKTVKIVAIYVVAPTLSTISVIVTAVGIGSCLLAHAAKVDFRYHARLREMLHVGAEIQQVPPEIQQVGYGLFADLSSRFPGADRIHFDIPSLAPMAFVTFCERYPQDCDIRGAADRGDLVSLTEMRRTELLQVNKEVNRTIRPREKTGDDSSQEWLVSPREGNCTDYAVTKRHKLLAYGWPSHALLLTEVIVPSGEHHLVLVVRTRDDDLVLDNLDERVRSVSQIPYRLVRAQRPKNPRFWSIVKTTHVL